MPNRLAKETSPYLLQHAENPVDWYPWGDEAFDAARERGVPVLLSVGYSSCHWCHVMERESFENHQIAAMMNDRFVSIKVDREERPDVDSVYMTAVQAMTGQGGWPMTVFMTAAGEPFYGGTYFPPEDRGGLPAFPRVLDAISDAFTNRRMEVLSSGRQLAERIRQTFTARTDAEPLTDGVLRAAFGGLRSQFDDQSGGFGLQPKFPQPSALEFLLRYHARTGSPDALEMVELTLDRMAAGGIHDQIGGGFHRYSTDAYWIVPHFEKMLYDNALLARLYTRAYQVTGSLPYARVAQGIVDYVLREMTSESGGFYSAQDADSEGVEGKFFVWRPEELTRILGPDDAQVVADYYGVTSAGNFEGRTILTVPNDPADVAAHHSMSVQDLDLLIESSNAKLLATRSERVPPMTDTKIIVSWNGLMLAALAETGAVFDREDYLDDARANADFMLDRMMDDGRLRRTDSRSPNGALGFLDDHAALIDGLLALHRADGGHRWLIEAEALARKAIDLFWDPVSQQLFDTGRDQESLIVRPRDVMDNPSPSGHSMMADTLLRLSTITGDSDMRSIATKSIRGVRAVMAQFPTGAGHWLCTLDSYLSDSTEVVVMTRAGSEGPSALLRRLASRYQPGLVVAASSEADSPPNWTVFQGRTATNGQPTAYVCRSYTCKLPTTNPDVMLSQLPPNA